MGTRVLCADGRRRTCAGGKRKKVCTPAPVFCGPCELAIGQTLEIGRPTFKKPAGATGDCDEATSRYEMIRDIINSLPAILQFTVTGFSPITGDPILTYTGAEPTLFGDAPHSVSGSGRRWFYEVPPHAPPAPPAGMIYVEAEWTPLATITCSTSPNRMRIHARLTTHAEGQSEAPTYSGNSCGTGVTVDSPDVDITDAGDCNTEQSFTWTEPPGAGYLDDASGTALLDAPP